MPHKHSVKIYVKNAYYHIYNRGVDKRTIFEDDKDYRVFLHLLKYYLSPPEDKQEHPLKNFISLKRPRPIKTLFGEVELLAFILMPNHFHLLIKQISKTGMTELMRKLSTTYAMYFNRRYNRIGHLFQGNYKAAMVGTDEYLLYLSAYIHRNCLDLQPMTGMDPVTIHNYPYSSYKYYLREKNAQWIYIKPILNYFEEIKNSIFNHNNHLYQTFVENKYQNTEEIIGDLIIES